MIPNGPWAVDNLLTTTPPATEPVTLAEAKSHLRVEIVEEDTLIGSLIASARQKCEAETRRAFVARSYELRLGGFPSGFGLGFFGFSEALPYQAGGAFRLPKPPLIAVQSIAYLDATGALVTLDPSRYAVQAGGVLAGSISPAYGTSFPTARQQPGSVRIAYTAGYGPTAADVPQGIKQAMLLLVGGWYRNREAMTPGPMSPMPMGVKALLSPFDWGSYGG